jgi:hypothetical protein
LAIGLFLSGWRHTLGEAGAAELGLVGFGFEFVAAGPATLASLARLSPMRMEKLDTRR